MEYNTKAQLNPPKSHLLSVSIVEKVQATHRNTFFILGPLLIFTGQKNSTANSYRFFQEIRVIS